MATKRNQLTTYVDEATEKWVRAQARKEVRSVSQYLAATLAALARGSAPVKTPQYAPSVRAPWNPQPTIDTYHPPWPVDASPIIPSKPAGPKPMNEDQLKMRARAMSFKGWSSDKEHEDYVGKAMRSCAITPVEKDKLMRQIESVIDKDDADDTIDANDDTDASDAEAQEGEPDLDANDTRPH